MTDQLTARAKATALAADGGGGVDAGRRRHPGATSPVRPTGPPSKRSSRRLDSLTGLRALAALSVFAGHAGSTHPTGGLLGPVFIATKSAVTFFFVLSGFGLSWGAFRRPPELHDFYWKRIARIVPSHLITWAVAVVVLLCMGGRPTLRLLSTLFLVQAWIPSSTYYYAPNSVSWSLSCYAFFYLLFPFLFRWLGALSLRAQVKLSVALLASLAVLDVGSLLAFSGAALAGDSSRISWLLYIFPPVRLIEFLLGMSAASIAKATTTPVPLLPSGILMLVAFYCSGLFAASIVAAWLVVPPVMLLLVSCSQADGEQRRTALSTRPLVWAGERSYAFYLTQIIFLGVIERAGQILGMPALFHLVDLPVALVSAMLLYRYVERPADRWIRARFAGTGKQRSPTSVAAA